MSFSMQVNLTMPKKSGRVPKGSGQWEPSKRPRIAIFLKKRQFLNDLIENLE